jgi:hypothetical protein
MLDVWRTEEVRTGFWWGNPREEDHVKALGVHGKIISKWISNNWNGGGGGMDWMGLAQDGDRWRAVAIYHIYETRKSHEEIKQICFDVYRTLSIIID